MGLNICATCSWEYSSSSSSR